MRSRLKWLALAIAVVVIAVAVTVIFGKSNTPKMQEGNLLANGDFSQADENGLPSGWYTDAYIHTVGYTDYSMENGVVTIVNHALNDARFAQKVDVQPDSLYCLTGYVRAQANGGLTWHNGLRFMGDVSHLASEVITFDRNYQTMTVTFAPEEGQNISTTGRVSIAGLTSGKTLYSSGKINCQAAPITATFNINGERGIHISVIRGFNILFNDISGHYTEVELKVP